MAIIWLNGRLLEAAEARIDPSDRGLLLGDGVFETMRATGGRVPLLNRHLARLETGARLLDLPIVEAMADLVAAIAETLAANGRLDGAVRLTLTRGPGGRGLALPAAPIPTLMLVTAPLPPPRPPARLVVAAGTRRNQHSPLARIKALGYLDAILALQEASAAGADDALLLNTADRLASATRPICFSSGIVHWSRRRWRRVPCPESPGRWCWRRRGRGGSG
jgi:branched-chain amino acid aminotransferase